MRFLRGHYFEGSGIEKDAVKDADVFARADAAGGVLALRSLGDHWSHRPPTPLLLLEGPWVTEEDFACLANSRPIVLDCSLVLLFVLAALNLSCKLSCRLYSVEYSLLPLLLLAVNIAHVLANRDSV
jgi:hypothetical protein